MTRLDRRRFIGALLAVPAAAALPWADSLVPSNIDRQAMWAYVADEDTQPFIRAIAAQALLDDTRAAAISKPGVVRIAEMHGRIKVTHRGFDGRREVLSFDRLG